jgi:hypothetical protein
LTTNLGPDHADTLEATNILGMAYLYAGETTAAIVLFEQVRDAAVKKLGCEHPYTLNTIINLAGAYQDSGKMTEAIALVEQVRDVAVKKLVTD